MGVIMKLIQILFLLSMSLSVSSIFPGIDKSEMVHLMQCVQEGQNFARAIDAALLAVCDNDKSVRDYGRQLFITLFDKKQGFSQARTVAFLTINSQNSCVQCSGVKISIELVRHIELIEDKKPILSLAFSAVMKAFDNTDSKNKNKMYFVRNGTRLLAEIEFYGFVLLEEIVDKAGKNIGVYSTVNTIIDNLLIYHSGHSTLFVEHVRIFKKELAKFQPKSKL